VQKTGSRVRASTEVIVQWSLNSGDRLWNDFFKNRRC
jgi:hypothetical protein